MPCKHQRTSSFDDNDDKNIHIHVKQRPFLLGKIMYGEEGY